MTALLRAPRVRLSWTATELEIYFQSYRVYWRPNRTPGQGFTLIGELSVPPGYDRETVEAQHTFFDDWRAGWYSEGGEWASGHDYVVTSVDISGAESQITQASVTAAGLTVPDPRVVWWVSNQAPFLNVPIELPSLTSSELASNVFTRSYAGRDHAVAITAAERPGRTLTASAEFFGEVGPDELRFLRRAANSGYQFVMLRPLGDRIVGKPVVSGFGDVYAARQAVQVGMIETLEDTIAEYNLPAGLVLNGTDEYLTTPDADHLDPGSSPFSVVMAAQFADPGDTKWALSKGNIGTTAGYSLGTTGAANTLEFKVSGASAFGSATEASASWFDGVRVAVGTSNGSLLSLYRDGTLVDTTAVTHGAVTNSTALLAGANNGASPASFMALNPLQSYAVYMRELSATEARDASYYLLGYPGYRMPAGAVLFVDLRDDRCSNGVSSGLNDLSPWANPVTKVGGATRGRPWPLGHYETV